MRTQQYPRGFFQILTIAVVSAVILIVLTVKTWHQQTACSEMQKVTLVFRDGKSVSYPFERSDVAPFVRSSRLIFAPFEGQPNAFPSSRLIEIDVADAICPSTAASKTEAVIYSFGPSRKIWPDKK